MRMNDKPILIDQSCEQAVFAAEELRYYFGRMSAFNAPIEADDGKKSGIALIHAGNNTELGTDGFTIDTIGDRLEIRGGDRGLIYGAYELLEKLGCRFFTNDCEYVPVHRDPELPQIHDKQIPIIEYREHNYKPITTNPKFSVKLRFNGGSHRIPKHMGGFTEYAWFVHTFEHMVPTAVYGEKHPEYYALVDGKRRVIDGGRTQLCLTNPDVLKLCIEGARKRLQECPDAGIISISQNDWAGGCQCENCRKADAEEGSASGTLLKFVNSVAEALKDEFPNVIFDTLAYNHTRPAPKTVRANKNVCVRLCSIEACFAHPFDKCDDESRCVLRPDGTKSRFIDDLREWGRQCSRMYIWDYTTCFAHYPTPHPNWRCLQPNVQAMAENNVKGIFEQANGASRGGVDFNELRAYLISKLLWDPYCDIEKHRKEFMDYYYGAAAPYLNEYLNRICDICEQENIHVGFNDNPVHGFLSEEHLDEYDALFDKAAAAVAGDAKRLWRVEKNRLSIRYVRLKRKAAMTGELDPEEINDFFGDWRAFGLSRIEEWFNVETSLRAMLDKQWRSVDYFDHWTGEKAEYL